ncbi:MAG: RloB family protein [Eubacteriales bacterium]
MSLKPLKASEIKKNQSKLNAKMNKAKKKIEGILPPYIYIISEGTKTEPNYIAGMVRTINSKYYDFGSKNRIVVKGTGRSTRSLLNYARKQVEKELPEATVVWLMYDKDDFPEDDFDNTQYSAEGRQDKREYRVAWSNECIELWFVWHYQELVSDNGREHCRKILEEKIGYEKKQQNIYDVLADKTEIAIQRAEKQYESYGEDVPPSKRCPATRVHELVKYLQQYL